MSSAKNKKLHCGPDNQKVEKENSIMAKKKFGKFVALATVSGVIAAGISYFLKYKSFNSELDEDFHDFEGDDDEFDGELPHASETPARTYVTLNEKKEEAADAVEEGVEKTADIVYDAADAVTDTVEAAAKKVQDTAGDAAEKAEDAAGTASENAADMSELVKAAVTETAEAVKNAVESNMSTTIEDDEM